MTTLDTTQQQVMQIFVDAGFPNPSVVGVAAGQNNYSYPPTDETQILYQIVFTTTPAGMSGLAKRLEALRNNLPPGLSSFQYAAALNASSAAVEKTHTAVLPELLAEARSKAAKLAAAASLTLGGIQAISESNYLTPGLSFSLISVGGGYSNQSNYSGTILNFYLNVKFAAQ